MRPEVDDRALVAATRTGDDTAFEELYRRYNRRVAAYVQRMVGDHDRAEDITQEAFFSALRRLRQTEAEIVFKPWIFEIAKNATIDQFRRTSRAQEVSIDPEAGGLRPADQIRLVGGGHGPDAALVSKERFDNLRGAFDELSESHVRILVMRELEGLSYREIGERMELTRPAVESTLFRARRRLNQEYAELDTGARCTAMTAAIARLAEGIESSRDRRRVNRHVSRCNSCRRTARELGVAVESQRRVRSHVAALLPFPALLRRRRSGSPDACTGAGAGGGVPATVQHAGATWAPALAPAGAETGVAAWGKAAAIVAAVAFAGGGAAVQEKITEDAGDRVAESALERADAAREAALRALVPAPPVVLSPRNTELPPLRSGSPLATDAAPGATRGGDTTRPGEARSDEGEGRSSPPSITVGEQGPQVGLPTAPDVGALGGTSDGSAQETEDGDGGGSGDGGGPLDGGGVDAPTSGWNPQAPSAPASPQPPPAPVDPGRGAAPPPPAELPELPRVEASAPELP